MTDTAIYRDQVPIHLKTRGQLRAAGLQPCDTGLPAGWLERAFDGDFWRTRLYDKRAGLPPGVTAPEPGVPFQAGASRPYMPIVSWARPERRRQRPASSVF